MKTTTTRLLFPLLTACAACTVINSLDDVKPLKDGTYTAATPNPPIEGGAPLDSGAPDTNVKAPALGAIVVAGSTTDAAGVTKFVIDVLDPATGKEIGPRVDMIASAIRYDGLKDVWYIFESKTDFALAPSDVMALHAKRLDLTTGVWTDLWSVPSAPPLQYFDSIAVLKDRLLYVAHSLNPVGVRLVTINTADNGPPNRVLDQQTLTGAVPRGMIGSRGTTTSAGGQAGIVRTVACAPPTPPTSCIEIAPVGVSDAVTSIQPGNLIGSLGGPGGVASYAAFASSDFDNSVVILPRTAVGGPSTAIVVDPRTPGTKFTVPFFVNDTFLRRAAVAECERMIFVVGGNVDLAVHAVPMLADDAGVPTEIQTSKSGQSVYYEPTSKTVLSPFSQGSGFELQAFHLSGTASAPKLTKRTAADWNPPADLRPVLLGVREVLPVVCN